MVAVGARRPAAGRNHRPHAQPGGEQLRRRGAPDLVLPAQHALPHRLPGRVQEVLQGAEGLRRRRGAPPFVQGQPLLCSPQTGGRLGEVAGAGHAPLHSALLPAASLPQPDRSSVGPPPRCQPLDQQVGSVGPVIR